jgi:hypothetical protein
MIYPEPALHPSPDLFPANDVSPGSLVFPGTDAFPGTNLADTGTTVSASPGDPFTSVTYSSPGGELSITLDPESTPPRAEIQISLPAGTATATLTRTDPSGEQWPVRTAEPAQLTTTGAWSGFDYELPYGTTMAYTLNAPGLSAPVVVSTGVFNVPPAWQSALIQPAAPSLSVPVRLYTGTTGTVTRSARQASLAVLGRARPLVVSDIRQARSAQLVVWCDTLDERDALTTIVADGSALRLACDPRLGWDIPQCYLAIGDVAEARAVADFPAQPFRVVTLPFLEVDRPITASPAGTTGGTTGGGEPWTYTRLDATYATYSELDAAYLTYADLALNRTA